MNHAHVEGFTPETFQEINRSQAWRVFIGLGKGCLVKKQILQRSDGTEQAVTISCYGDAPQEVKPKILENLSEANLIEAKGNDYSLTSTGQKEYLLVEKHLEDEQLKHDFFCRFPHLQQIVSDQESPTLAEVFEDLKKDG